MKKRAKLPTDGKKREGSDKIVKKQISIRIDAETIDYFKKMATETGISYQNLMNIYLTDCASKKQKIKMMWG